VKTLLLVKREGAWFVEAESLKKALEAGQPGDMDQQRTEQNGVNRTAAAPQAKTDEPGSGPGKKQSVEGVLRHVSPDVKSEQTWLGHEYLVDGIPILPTDAVTAAMLQNMVGKKVRIEGCWNPGKEVKDPDPPEPESALQRPSYPDGIKVRRGDGIEAASLREVE
jgi:hypothetical protein